MIEKLESIEEKLQDYQTKVIKYINEYINEIKYFLSDENEEDIFISQAADSLLFLTAKEIYPYIAKTQPKLKEEFIKRVNYYQKLKDNDKFKLLCYELHDAINELYSLIDLNTALLIQEEPFVKFYCTKALASLKNTHRSVDNTNYYEQIIEQIKNKANFYVLDLNQTCEELCQEIERVDIFSSDNILDIRKIIAQYDALEQPIKIDIVNQFPNLISNVDRFKEIYFQYVACKNQLKDLLMKDFKPKGLFYFYLFNKLIKCKNACKFALEIDAEFKCSVCFMSILLVLIYLQCFISESKENFDKNIEDAKKLIVDLKGSLNSISAELKESNGEKYKGQLTKQQLLEKISLIPSRKKVLEFVLKNDVTAFAIGDLYAYYFQKGDGYSLDVNEKEKKVKLLSKYLSDVNKALQKYFDNNEGNYIYPEKISKSQKNSDTWHVNIPVKIN